MRKARLDALENNFNTTLCLQKGFKELWKQVIHWLQIFYLTKGTAGDALTMGGQMEIIFVHLFSAIEKLGEKAR